MQGPVAFVTECGAWACNIVSGSFQALASPYLAAAGHQKIQPQEMRIWGLGWRNCSREFSRERLRRVPFKKSPVIFVCQSSSSHHHHRHLIIIIIIIISSSSSSHHHLIIIIFSSSSHHHHHLSPLSLLLFFSFPI